MEVKLHTFVLAAAAVFCCGCLTDVAFATDDLPSEGPGAAKTIDVAAPQEVCKTQVKELSGLCFNAARDGFYAVGDEGAVYETDLAGNTRKVLYEGKNHDWEGVDFDGSSIWLIDETESTLYTLSDGILKKVAKVEIPGGGAAGKGPEGIMCKGDTVYVANQAQPTRIVKYCRSTGTVTGAVDIKFVTKFLSDLCYDPTDNTMWIVDSKGPAFYHCTLDGQLLATYNIPFVEQAEALVVDSRDSIAWVGCDVTSTIYKIKL